MNAAKTTYRPARLAEIVGHAKIKASLRILLQAAIRKATTLPHLLFTGPPGLGKTTFSLALSTEIGGKLIQRHADGLSTDLMYDVIRDIEPNTVLFIDEIHRLKPKTCEVLYGALEDFRVTIKNTLVDLPRFTCIGATTHVGMLPEPFRRRFRHVQNLSFLNANDLSLVSWNAMWAQGLFAEPGACYEIGRRAKGTPRRAVHLVEWAADYALTHGANGNLHAPDARQRPLVTIALVRSALRANEIDTNGFDVLDRKYLRAIREKFEGGPVGVDTLAACLGEAACTLEDEIEPWLLRRGVIAITPRGRQLKGKGKAHGTRTS